MPETSQIQGEAAGVPYLAFVPDDRTPTTPLVVALHLMDPPRSEAAMAAALPFAGIEALRVYLGLPMFGSRAPAGGFEEIFRLAEEDGLMNLLAPVIEQAAAELPEALAALRRDLDASEAPIVLVGGSAGGAAVLLALAETAIDAAAAVLINPATSAAAVVETVEALMGVNYQWTERSRDTAARLDLRRLAPALSHRQTETAYLFVVGAEDDNKGLPVASRELSEAIESENPGLATFIEVPGLGHALAEEPGLEAAPQTEGAATVDRIVADWLRERLRA